MAARKRSRSPVKQYRFAFCILCTATLFLTAAGWPGESRAEEQAMIRALDQISAERMLADVTLLSSESFNGRQAGTPDDERAAEYFSRQMTELASSIPITPVVMPDSPPITMTEIAPKPILAFLFPGPSDDRTVSGIGKDYLPVLDSPSVRVEAPIVFVGYGIVDNERGFDEYAGIDVKDHVVLFLRGKPEGYSGQSSHADKVRIAHEKGAVAYLTATGPILNAYEVRRGLGGKPSAYYSQAAVGLAGAWVTTDLAERIVAAGGEALSSRQQRLNHLSPQSHVTSVVARLEWTSKRTRATLHNVGYLLTGSDTERPDDTVLLGAHRDHFGRQAGILFAGADDNASGTAVILEVARAIAGAGVRPKRSIFFVSFTGEEQGLIGSTSYVRHPARRLDKTKAMINVDHAGIGNGRLTVGVTGLDKSLAGGAGRLAGMVDELDLFGFFPGGDHVPFKEAGVPTFTIVSGGAHRHFHQPTDRVDTISTEILAKAARYTLALTLQLANAP
ncbi:M20/M25/M40 family metallo-hydrolase [Nitrospira sp. Nam80]